MLYTFGESLSLGDMSYGLHVVDKESGICINFELNEGKEVT